MTRRHAERLVAATGLLLGMAAGLAFYEFATFIANRWNPFL